MNSKRRLNSIILRDFAGIMLTIIKVYNLFYNNNI